MISAAVGIAVLVLALGIIGTQILRDTTNKVLEERRRTAEYLASYLDSTLAADAARLGLLARSILMQPEMANQEQFRRFIRETFAQMQIFRYSLLLVDPQGNVILSEPGRPGYVGTNLVNLPPIRGALSSLKPQTSGLLWMTDGVPVAMHVHPIVGPDGKVRGMIAGLAALSEGSLLPHIYNSQTEGTEHWVVIDQEGWVLSSTVPEKLFTREEHPELFTELIRKRLSTVAVSGNKGGGRGEPHVMATAPLANSNWSIGFGQSLGEVMQPVNRLRFRVLLFGLVAVTLAVVYAWWDTRAVTRPLISLTKAAQRMAAGDLDTPVNIQRYDEIGTLAQAFETMRVHLKESRMDLERAMEETRRQERVAAVFKERERIAREMHDSVCQALGYLYSQIRLLQEQLPVGLPPKMRSMLDEIANVASATYDEVRQAIFGLRTASFTRHGLISAIAGSVRDFTARTGIPADFHGEAMGAMNFSPQAEAQLIRIIQEALNNVAKHAGAQHVSVCIEPENDMARIVIADDGRGFDPARVLAARENSVPGNLGLLTMKERAESVGGTLQIDSSPGAGTRVVVRIPLERPSLKGGRDHGDHSGPPGR